MTFLAYAGLAVLTYSTLVAPYIKQRAGRRRVRLTECARIAPKRRADLTRYDTTTPRFQRDPSPRPRGDGEWRAIAEGDAQR